MASGQDIIPSELVRPWTPIFSNQLNQNADITEVKFVASYCWFNPDQSVGPPENPTLVIPGCIPRLRSNLKFPLTCEADETPCVDLNSTQVRHKDLLQPLFLSVKMCEPEFEFTEMDVICDSSKLRLLIEWCKKPKTFSMDAEMLRDRTMVLYAFENKKDYNQHNVNSFRRDFHRKITDLPTGWDHTFGNYRIISYRYADLKMLVRSPQFVRDETDNESFDNPAWLSEPEGTFNGLKFIRSGKIEPQKNLVKLQYTAPKKALKKAEIWHKLYFSQIPLLLEAYRREPVGRKADFQSIDRLTFRNDFEYATSDARQERNMLLQMLHAMRKLLLEERENGNSKLSFHFKKGSSTIQVFTCNFPSQLEGWNCNIAREQ
ncbi:uncharacterized protein LOC119069148 [Bradysia coprophila]|uniref:uncharacterized protein LOC119069148 n=1 Tax=Bradysia coprophila TaxID=38358 RepID=UPI00187DA1AC|nr:uncharacterized protein LOC119069148 [Bradysia coprophila]